MIVVHFVHFKVRIACSSTVWNSFLWARTNPTIIQFCV